MVLIFSTPLNLGLESSCIEKRPFPLSLALSFSPSQKPGPRPLERDRAMGLWMVARRRELVVGNVIGKGRAGASEEERECWRG